jgi:CheY-like chemotaxis protein
MKVLVVEDEELLRAVAVQALEDAGFQVIEATTGEEAISKCQRLSTFSSRISASPARLMAGTSPSTAADPKLPVIYATGYSHVKPRPVPGSRFFHKPYRLEGVIQAICELSANRPTRA